MQEEDVLSERSITMYHLLQNFPSIVSFDETSMDTILLFLTEARTLLPVKTQWDARYKLPRIDQKKKKGRHISSSFEYD